MSRGWYLMHRGWMESADFRREAFSEPQAFLWSIEQAAFEPHRQWFNGTQYEVGRGEFVTSLHGMMTAFGWSEKRVRGFRDRMVRAQKWAKRGANVGAKAPTVLTVCNYALFQSGIYPNQVLQRVQRRGAPGFKYYEEMGSAYFRMAGTHFLAKKLDMVAIYNTLGEAFHVTRLALNHLSEKLVFLETDRAVRDLLREVDGSG